MQSSSIFNFTKAWSAFLTPTLLLFWLFTSLCSCPRLPWLYCFKFSCYFVKHYFNSFESASIFCLWSAMVPYDFFTTPEFINCLETRDVKNTAHGDISSTSQCWPLSGTIQVPSLAGRIQHLLWLVWGGHRILLSLGPWPVLDLACRTRKGRPSPTDGAGPTPFTWLTGPDELDTSALKQ